MITKNKSPKAAIKLTTILPILLISVYLISCGSNKKITKEIDANSIDNDNAVFILVEQMPEFPGGQDGVRRFLSATIEYPKEAQARKIKGKVFVSFIIEKDGSVSNVKVMRKVNPLLDEEAVRVIKLMPKWTPGVQRGKPVRVSYTIPINFSLH